MKRFLLPLLGVVLFAGVLAGGGLLWAYRAPPEPYSPVGAGDTYLALGDSLAAGFTVGDPAEAYVARIASRLRQENPAITVRNLSVPGETSASLRGGQLARAKEFIAAEQAAGRRVSPITLDIGGNDARAVQRADSATRVATMQRVETNLGRVLDELLAATRDASGRRTADLVVMTYYNPYGGELEDEVSPAYWMAELNQAILRAAAARGVPVADVAGAFGGGLVYRYTYVATGDIHANADGHRVIAEHFWRALAYPGDFSTQP